MNRIQFVFALAFLSAVLTSNGAEAVRKNDRITQTKEALVGTWKLKSGPNEEAVETGSTWKITADNRIEDSASPTESIKYYLVETEGGEIWIMLLTSPGPDSPFMMRVKVEADSLVLDYVGGLKGGGYGAHDKGGLKFVK